MNLRYVKLDQGALSCASVEDRIHGASEWPMYARKQPSRPTIQETALAAEPPLNARRQFQAVEQSIEIWPGERPVADPRHSYSSKMNGRRLKPTSAQVQDEMALLFATSSIRLGRRNQQ